MVAPSTDAPTGSNAPEGESAAEAKAASEKPIPKAKSDVISAMEPAELEAEERAELAIHYFLPLGKKRKLGAPLRGFAPELLCNTPSNIQTCRSLRVFLEKKIQANTLSSTPPEVQGPEDLKHELEMYAEEAGRVAAIVKPCAYDARVRRILDLTKLTEAPEGKELVSKAQAKLQQKMKELDLQLKERGELDAEKLTKQRQTWAEGLFQRDWLAWCERLLQAREANLLLAGNPQTEQCRSEYLTAGQIVTSLLSG